MRSMSEVEFLTPQVRGSGRRSPSNEPSRLQALDDSRKGQLTCKDPICVGCDGCAGTGHSRHNSAAYGAALKLRGHLLSHRTLGPAHGAAIMHTPV